MEKVILSSEDLFVAFSLPGEQSIQLMKADGGEKYQFVIHPFIRNSVETTYVKSSVIHEDVKLSFKTNSKNHTKPTLKSEYLSQSKKLLSSIKSDLFGKAILSRIKTVPLINPDFGDVFNSLVSSNQKAFCYLFHIPGQGSWMGASPEVLLQSSQHGFETVALAGTLPNPEFGDPNWSQKEKNEQQFIVDYVRDKLDARGIQYSLEGPRNSIAGNVVHLKSVFSSKEVIDPVDVALALHPGPAISGFPVDKALAFIAENESHDREYYCGFLGPVSNQETTLYINLRCMQLFEDSVSIYVGGGYTIDSDPEAEWEETELKSQTLLAVLEDSYLAI